MISRRSHLVHSTQTSIYPGVDTNDIETIPIGAFDTNKHLAMLRLDSNGLDSPYRYDPPQFSSFVDTDRLTPCRIRMSRALRIHIHKCPQPRFFGLRFTWPIMQRQLQLDKCHTRNTGFMKIKGNTVDAQVKSPVPFELLSTRYV